jgi:hypothetical protein
MLVAVPRRLTGHVAEVFGVSVKLAAVGSPVGVNVGAVAELFGVTLATVAGAELPLLELTSVWLGSLILLDHASDRFCPRNHFLRNDWRDGMTGEQHCGMFVHMKFWN